MRITESQLRMIIRNQLIENAKFQGFSAYDPANPHQMIGVDPAAAVEPDRETFTIDQLYRTADMLGGPLDHDEMERLTQEYIGGKKWEDVTRELGAFT